MVSVYLTRFIHKYIHKMNKAYLRHLTDLEKFEISFLYNDPTLKINRQFNLCRQVSESISSFTSRVSTNIEKIVKKKQKNLPPCKVEVFISINGTVVDAETPCGEVFNNGPNQILLNVCKQEYEVIINAPWINSVALPSSILATFPIYPIKFESMYMDKEKSEFIWFKSKDKNTWTRVGDGFIYNPPNSDIDHYLKIHCVPKNDKFEGPTSETISPVTVQAGPGFCPFETRHLFTKDKCEGKKFRIVSYNILADLYCDLEYTKEVLHPYCPPYALSMDYRKHLIIKEIKGYNADLICLQEVDKKIYIHDLQPIFEKFGYGSDFCIKRGLVAEGEALFYNRARFKLLETFRFVLSDEIDKNPLFTDIWEKIKLNKKLSDRVLDRSTVLQTNILNSLDNNEILIVANTHLYFHPDSDHIRLIQGAVIIKYLENIVEQFRNQFEKRVSLILCGDLNSTPDCGIYQLYTKGFVQEDCIDFQSNVEESVKMRLKQNILLKSACGTPTYTNFTAGFADCLDYIYCEASNFEVVQVVPFPSKEELTQHTALPSIVFPSDHLALISDLIWT